MNKVQQEALSTLEGMAEEGYRTFTSKLIPSEGRRIIGVRIPRIRALAARIAKAGGLCDLMAPLPPSACYEMVMLKACAFAHMDGPSGEIQAQVLRFITEVDGWGSCDSLAASLKDARAHPDEWWPFVKKLFSHPYPYARRLAMVSCIWFFCDKEHLEEALGKSHEPRPIISRGSTADPSKIDRNSQGSQGRRRSQQPRPDLPRRTTANSKILERCSMRNDRVSILPNHLSILP